MSSAKAQVSSSKNKEEKMLVKICSVKIYGSFYIILSSADNNNWLFLKKKSFLCLLHLSANKKIKITVFIVCCDEVIRVNALSMFLVIHMQGITLQKWSQTAQLPIKTPGTDVFKTLPRAFLSMQSRFRGQRRWTLAYEPRSDKLVSK